MYFSYCYQILHLPPQAPKGDVSYFRLLQQVSNGYLHAYHSSHPRNLSRYLSGGAWSGICIFTFKTSLVIQSIRPLGYLTLFRCTMGTCLPLGPPDSYRGYRDGFCQTLYSKPNSPRLTLFLNWFVSI